MILFVEKLRERIESLKLGAGARSGADEEDTMETVNENSNPLNGNILLWEAQLRGLYGDEVIAWA